MTLDDAVSLMRKVDVVRPPINYVVIQTSGYAKGSQIAWFVEAGDAQDFIDSQTSYQKELTYEIAEVRK